MVGLLLRPPRGFYISNTLWLFAHLVGLIFFRREIRCKDDKICLIEMRNTSWGVM